MIDKSILFKKVNLENKNKLMPSELSGGMKKELQLQERL